MKTDKKKKSFWEKFAHKELSKAVSVQSGHDLFLLSEGEKSALKTIRKIVFIKAGIAGALGVILLYLPYHLFGDLLFPTHQIWIPYYDNYIELELSFLIYSVVLVLIEIWYLTYINIKAVSTIAHLCGLWPRNPVGFLVFLFPQDVTVIVVSRHHSIC